MSGLVRAFVIAAVIGIATLGEGGASASSLVVQHVLLALGLAVCVFGLRPANATPAKGPAVGWLIFAALAAAGAAAAPYAYAAWLVMIEIVAFGTIAWMSAGDPAAWARIVPPVLACYAGAHGLVALVEKASGIARPASTFLNPNHLAAWLSAASLVAAGALADRAAGKGVRFFYGAAWILAVFGTVVTGSRGAALGLLAGSALFGAAMWAGLPRRGRRALVAAAAVTALAVIVTLAVRLRTDDDPYRFYRTRIWAASARVLASAPWSGTGPGQFAAAAGNLNFPVTDAPLRFERGFKTPHSDLLRAFCEFGIPAGLAALAASLVFVIRTVRRRSSLSAIERGAAAALVALAVQGLVDDLSTRPALTVLVAALVGLLVASARRNPPGAASEASSRVVALLLVGALGLGEIAGFTAWHASSDLPRGRLDAAQLARLRFSLRANPAAAGSWQRLAEHFAGDGRSWDLSDYAQAREAAEHAGRLQPADEVYARELARIEAAACLSIMPFQASRDRAAGLYDAAASLARTDATVPLEEARFLLQAGDPAKARRAAEAAIRLEPAAASARLTLAEAIAASKGPAGRAEAGKLLDDAIALEPPPGTSPSSPYEASLRWLDPERVARLRRALDEMRAP